MNVRDSCLCVRWWKRDEQKCVLSCDYILIMKLTISRCRILWTWGEKDSNSIHGDLYDFHYTLPLNIPDRQAKGCGRVLIATTGATPDLQMQGKCRS